LARLPLARPLGLARSFRGFPSRSIDPLPGFGSEDRQLFHHELRFPDCADHVRAGGAIPVLRHALAGMAAPALYVSAVRKIAPAYPAQLVLVQPRFARAVDHVAVVEHETGAIRVPEIFKAGNLHLVSWLALVQVVDHVRPGIKPNKI